MPRRNLRGQETAGRRAEVSRVLRRAARPLTIVDIAGRIGVHPNTVRFHLVTLVEHGQVERVEADRRAPGRPPQLFRAVRGMDPAGARHYRVLAEILADAVGADQDPRGRPVDAGRAWGRRQAGAAGDGRGAGGQASVGRLVTLLDELGFAPERGAGDHRPEGGRPLIRLRNCPFLELAASRPQVICPIHLGLMQGAMDAWGSPVTVDRLDPLVEPDLCVAHLTTGGT